jgi:hypothetical protein
VRVGIFSFALLSIRLTAVAMFFVLDQDYEQLGMAVLTTNKYFYLGYCLAESSLLGFLWGASIKFYFYHKWLRDNNLTTYNHITMKKGSDSPSSKVLPLTKAGHAKPGVFKRDSPTAAKAKGRLTLTSETRGSREEKKLSRENFQFVFDRRCGFSCKPRLHEEEGFH